MYICICIYKAVCVFVSLSLSIHIYIYLCVTVRRYLFAAASLPAFSARAPERVPTKPADKSIIINIITTTILLL